ncbi:MAG: DUF192 domain-containing protein [Syntrophomonadaceae bacterium]|nr:DUF192 domain-containing protein [Syntrophomonadaceae bacterium]
MSTNPTCQMYIKDKNQVIGSRIELARGFFSRLRGLLGRKGLDDGAGLLLSPCSSIHCWGMRFPIDAVFLDKEYQVVAIYPDMKPGSVASHRQARHVLELKAGAARQYDLETGDTLTVTTD